MPEAEVVGTNVSRWCADSTPGEEAPVFYGRALRAADQEVTRLEGRVGNATHALSNVSSNSAVAVVLLRAVLERHGADMAPELARDISEVAGGLSRELATVIAPMLERHGDSLGADRVRGLLEPREGDDAELGARQAPETGTE